MTFILNRRKFVETLCAGAAASVLPAGRSIAAETTGGRFRIKPIRGSWISILWNDKRHHYWNDSCARFSAEQWGWAVKEVADIGMEYLVLLATVIDGKALYDSSRLGRAKELACPDPLEAMLGAADQCGVKFFISGGFLGGWLGGSKLNDPEITRQRFGMMEEVVAKYGRHRSFYGWYWPDEPAIPYFPEPFIEYVNAYSREARKLTPKSKVLIAPYGTNRAVGDEKYVRQLERLDVDVVAYQDEVGCRRLPPEPKAIARAFAALRQAHDKVPQRAMWADVELFDWEGPPNQQTSPLIPATFARLEKQLAAVSPYVDVVTVYQYQGIMNKPGSKAPAGHPDATRFYTEYVNWLKANYPDIVK